MNKDTSVSAFRTFYDWAASLPVFAQIPIGLGLFLLAIGLVLLVLWVFVLLDGVSQDLEFEVVKTKVSFESAVEKDGRGAVASRLYRQYVKARCLQFLWVPASLTIFVILIAVLTIPFG